MHGQKIDSVHHKRVLAHLAIVSLAAALSPRSQKQRSWLIPSRPGLCQPAVARTISQPAIVKTLPGFRHPVSCKTAASTGVPRPGRPVWVDRAAVARSVTLPVLILPLPPRLNLSAPIAPSRPRSCQKSCSSSAGRSSTSIAAAAGVHRHDRQVRMASAGRSCRSVDLDWQARLH
jgi:hypothetical protein